FCDSIIRYFFYLSAATYSYTVSLHDALPISCRAEGRAYPDAAARGHETRQAQPAAHHHGGAAGCVAPRCPGPFRAPARLARAHGDRKSTRLNSSHVKISYAVFSLKKKQYRQY